MLKEIMLRYEDFETGACYYFKTEYNDQIELTTYNLLTNKILDPSWTANQKELISSYFKDDHLVVNFSKKFKIKLDYSQIEYLNILFKILTRERLLDGFKLLETRRID